MVSSLHFRFAFVDLIRLGQPKNSIPTVSSTIGCTSISHHSRSSSFRSMPALAFVLVNRQALVYTPSFLPLLTEYRFQFAYNEMSFMLIRLLQQFDTISLAPDAQASDTLPPPSWGEAGGRKATEKIFPKMHLTMYAHVSSESILLVAIVI